VLPLAGQALSLTGGAGATAAPPLNEESDGNAVETAVGPVGVTSVKKEIKAKKKTAQLAASS
jgi:hypothetical protein